MLVELYFPIQDPLVHVTKHNSLTLTFLQQDKKIGDIVNRGLRAFVGCLKYVDRLSRQK